jgi:YD repeat-containing protein
VPDSAAVDTDPTGPRYYVYNGRGDVVALSDASGNVVASYGYDAFGAPTSISESFTNGWTNPYRYDGRDLVRFDGETGLYWMRVRAYRVQSGGGILCSGGRDAGAITDRVLARQSLCCRCTSRSPKRGIAPAGRLAGQ